MRTVSLFASNPLLKIRTREWTVCNRRRNVLILGPAGRRASRNAVIEFLRVASECSGRLLDKQRKQPWRVRVWKGICKSLVTHIMFDGSVVRRLLQPNNPGRRPVQAQRRTIDPARALARHLIGQPPGRFHAGPVHYKRALTRGKGGPRVVDPAHTSRHRKRVVRSPATE